jgi:serine/threonine protein kinase
MAPELFMNTPYDGPSVDVFALGVMFFLMLTGKPPFEIAGDDWYKLMQEAPVQICEARGITMSQESLDLATKLIADAAADRLTLKEILQHKWMTDGHTASQEEVQAFWMDVQNNQI